MRVHSGRARRACTKLRKHLRSSRSLYCNILIRPWHFHAPSKHRCRRPSDKSAKTAYLLTSGCFFYVTTSETSAISFMDESLGMERVCKVIKPSSVVLLRHKPVQHVSLQNIPIMICLSSGRKGDSEWIAIPHHLESHT